MVCPFHAALDLGLIHVGRPSRDGRPASNPAPNPDPDPATATLRFAPGGVALGSGVGPGADDLATPPTQSAMLWPCLIAHFGLPMVFFGFGFDFF